MFGIATNKKGPQLRAFLLSFLWAALVLRRFCHSLFSAFTQVIPFSVFSFFRVP
jgi:hypothetical protein